MRSEDYLIYTPQLMHLCIILKKLKIYIKTLKTLLHVSIIRSSSGSTYCSLLKLQIKTIVLIYNLGKEQYVLPEDDRLIETCRSVYKSLFKDLALNYWHAHSIITRVFLFNSLQIIILQSFNYSNLHSHSLCYEGVNITQI